MNKKSIAHFIESVKFNRNVIPTKEVYRIDSFIALTELYQGV